MLSAGKTRSAVFVALAISLFWVVLCWGIWERQMTAMGINYLLFTVAVAVLFSVQAGERRLERKHLPWIIPVGLIAASFFLYENPFIKAVHILVLPVLFACYRIAVMTPNYAQISWNGEKWIRHLIRRMVGAVQGIGTALEMITQAILPFESRGAANVRKVFLGLVIFILLAAFVFIPLLGSADPAFAEMMRGVMEKFYDLLSMESVFRTIFFAALSIALLAMAVRWNLQTEFREDNVHTNMDAIISGVVLGGILILYLLFLFTQVRSLWVGSLPTAFSETEVLVKKGFWQLFTLSIINVLLFLVYYRRTKPVVQHILTLFTFASLFLLFSAANRMGMYVWFYGLSYEKFFASYTVLFALILFGYLIRCLFTPDRKDIVKFLVYAFFWMYAVVAILPSEQFIFRTNSRLSERPDSRIDMGELQMLSSDVYGLVEQESAAHPRPLWEEWLSGQQAIHAKKAWYEWNLQDFKLMAMLSDIKEPGEAMISETERSDEVPDNAYDAVDLLGFGAPSAEPLPAAKEDEVVIRYGGWSLKQLTENEGTRELMWMDEANAEEAWLTTSLSPGVYRLKKGEAAPAVLMATALLAYRVRTGKEVDFDDSQDPLMAMVDNTNCKFLKGPEDMVGLYWGDDWGEDGKTHSLKLVVDNDYCIVLGGGIWEARK